MSEPYNTAATDPRTTRVCGADALARAVIATGSGSEVIVRQRLRSWANDGEITVTVHSAAVAELDQLLAEVSSPTMIPFWARRRLARSVNNTDEHGRSVNNPPGRSVNEAVNCAEGATSAAAANDPPVSPLAAGGLDGLPDHADAAHSAVLASCPQGKTQGKTQGETRARASRDAAGSVNNPPWVVGETMAAEVLDRLSDLEVRGLRGDLRLWSVSRLTCPAGFTLASLQVAALHLAFDLERSGGAAWLVFEFSPDGHPHLHGLLLVPDAEPVLEMWPGLVGGSPSANMLTVVKGSARPWTAENLLLAENLYRPFPKYAVCSYAIKDLPPQHRGPSLRERVYAGTGVLGAAWNATAVQHADLVDAQPHRLLVLAVGEHAPEERSCRYCGGPIPLTGIGGRKKYSSAEYCKRGCVVMASRDRSRWKAEERAQEQAQHEVIR